MKNILDTDQQYSAAIKEKLTEQRKSALIVYWSLIAFAVMLVALTVYFLILISF